ncbi:TPA: septation protein SpoVG family protein [Legionella pneumophila subsp. fraseri]|nr:septation protein SpoVG family protein [Legionella pneumophila]HBI2947562.1 septation protein SpoVG family protein [Legionella pneumophila]HDV6632767.1 septation protein SpoVG family protein [Legionella pneumophila]
MKISEVHIEFIKPRDGLIGFASFVIEDSIYISSIAIHKKLNGDGYRLTYPSKGNFTICHPINKKASQEIEAAIFSQLKNVMNKVNHNVQKLQSPSC